MRNKIKWIWLFIPLIWGCFDDKGNYTYHDLNEVSVDNIAWNNNINYGDAVDIIPKLHFTLDSVNVNLKYEWILGDVVVDSTPELHIKSFKYYTGGRRCYFRVEDVDTKMKYVTPFMISVSGAYQTGWLILSEKDNHSSISYIKEQKKTDEDGNVIETIYGVETDVYQNVNGAQLGQGPIRFHEHYNGDLYSSIGQILVMQESGSLELDGKTLSKVIDTQKEFLGETYPANFKIKDAMYTFGSGYLLSDKGEVYYRTNADVNAYQTGRFLRNPKKDLVTGKNLNCSNFLMPFFGLYECRTVLLFDRSEEGYGRFLFMQEDPYYPDKSGVQVKNIELAEKVTYPAGFTRLDHVDKELTFWGWQQDGGYSADNTSIFSILKNNKNGQYYIQKFNYVLDYTKILYITPLFEELFAGSNNITTRSTFALSRNTPFVYFSGGANNDELYFCSIVKGTTDCEKAKLTFASSIASIAVSLTGDRIAVALENGEFYLLNADALRTEQILYHIPAEKNIGKIKDCIFKVGTTKNWAYGEEE